MVAPLQELNFSCTDLDVVIGGRTLLRGLQHRFAPGAMTAVLGQNGAGKTTTLHTLAGIHPPGNGEVTLADQPLRDWSRRALAQTLGLLMQGYELPFPSTVLASVLVGRHPHIDLLQWESAADFAVARAALNSVGLYEDLEQRDVATLSGGERQRLAIATVLAQETGIVLLDEPVSNLDPRYQIMVMRLLRELAEQGRTVILSLHDVNLARAYCDNALLLFGDGSWQADDCKRVINADNLSRLYATRFAQADADGLPFFYAA